MDYPNSHNNSLFELFVHRDHKYDSLPQEGKEFIVYIDGLEIYMLRERLLMMCA